MSLVFWYVKITQPSKAVEFEFFECCVFIMLLLDAEKLEERIKGEMKHFVFVPFFLVLIPRTKNHFNRVLWNYLAKLD